MYIINNNILLLIIIIMLIIKFIVHNNSYLLMMDFKIVCTRKELRIEFFYFLAKYCALDNIISFN